MSRGLLALCVSACLFAGCHDRTDDRARDDEHGRVTIGNEPSGTAYSPAMDEGNERRTSARPEDATNAPNDSGDLDRDQIQRGPAAPTAPYGERGTAAGNTGKGDVRGNGGDLDQQQQEQQQQPRQDANQR